MPPTGSSAEPSALARRALALFVRPVARRAGLTLGVAVAVALASATEPLVLRHLIDFLAGVGAAGSVGAPPPATLRALWSGVGAVALVMALRVLGQSRVTVGVWKVRLGIEYQLRSRVAAKFSVLSGRTQAEIGTGGLRYAIEQSAPQTAVAFTDLAYRLVPTLVYVSVAAWGMLRLERTIAVAVLCLVPIPAGVAALAARAQTARARAHQSFFTRLWAWYDEVLHGMGTVRAFANERHEERRFMRRTRWAFASIHRGVHMDAQVTAAAGLSELAARAVVLGYGGWLVVRGGLSLGGLLALWGYVGGVFAPVALLVEVYPALRKARVALGAVFAVLDAEEEAPDVPGAVPAPALAGRVTFEGVSFAYDGGTGGRRALDAFDVDIAPGSTVALVGPSGSGKSTVLRLLQRVHQPTAGRVLLDGHDLRGLQAASVRRQLGVGAAGGRPLRRLGGGEHRLRAAERDARRGRGGGAGGERARLHPRAPERVRAPPGGRGARALGRAAAARRHRAGVPRRPGGAAARRGHGGARHRERAAGAGGAARSAEGAHDVRRRAPAEHDPRRGPDSGAAGRAGGRGRNARAVACSVSDLPGARAGANGNGERRHVAAHASCVISDAGSMATRGQPIGRNRATTVKRAPGWCPGLARFGTRQRVTPDSTPASEPKLRRRLGPAAQRPAARK
jgi:ABC-type multidrug transport system fused ATPase/permease subunit